MLLGRVKPPRAAAQGSVGLRERVFVGAGAVDGWDGNVEKAQVDGELAAVVIEVVEHDVAYQLNPRDGENFLAVRAEAPDSGRVLLGQIFEIMLGGLHAGLEGIEDFLFIFWLRGNKAVGPDLVHLFLRNDANTAGDAGDVVREFAERHGFGVRRPVEFVGGNAVEDAAGGGGFTVKFVEHGG